MEFSALLFFSVHAIMLQTHMLQATAQDGGYTVRNVTCVITQNSWIIPDRITVRWRLPETTNASDVTVKWLSDQNTDTCSQWNLTSCMCRYGDANCMDFHSYFEIHVTAEGRMNAFAIDTDMCRKPPRLDGIDVHATNSTCINVTWHYDVTESTLCSERDVRVYQISYRADADTTWEYISMDKTQSCSGRSVLCVLTPFTLYHVAVRCKFTNHKRQAIGHWSDPAEKTTTTLQSVPTGAPGLVPGGYAHLHEDCPNDVRTVRLYWKPVDPKKRHGIITAYHISVFLQLGSTQTVQQELQRPGESVSADLTLHCSADYTVVLAAATTAGVSNDVSRTLIPHTMDGALPEVADVIPIVTGTSSLTVLWELREAVADNGTSLMVIWCLKASVAKCKGSPTWQTLHPESTQLAIYLPNNQPTHHYMVGVSAGDRGITWTTCQFSTDIVPPRPVGVSVSPAGSDRTLSVSWENRPCEARVFGPYIDHFLIRLCPVSTENDRICSGPVVSATVDHDETSCLIYDLDPDTLYKVNVIAVGRNRTTSPLSNDVYVTIPVTSDVFNMTWVIILTSLAGVVLVVFVVVVIARWLRRRIEKQKRVRVPDVFPLPDESSNLTAELQLIC